MSSKGAHLSHRRRSGRCSAIRDAQPVLTSQVLSPPFWPFCHRGRPESCMRSAAPRVLRRSSSRSATPRVLRWSSSRLAASKSVKKPLGRAMSLKELKEWSVNRACVWTHGRGAAWWQFHRSTDQVKHARWLNSQAPSICRPFERQVVPRTEPLVPHSLPTSKAWPW
jgi:hypothetical protein